MLGKVLDVTLEPKSNEVHLRGVTNDTLLGHIVSWEGVVVDSNKVKAILGAPTPTNAKALSRRTKVAL